MKKTNLQVVEGRKCVSDEERSGQTAMNRTEENIAEVCQIMREGHLQSGT
jgi:hypothetical protein